MTDLLRVVQYGLGPIGLATARVLLDKQRAGLLTLVGAIDIDPQKAGRDLGELLGEEAVGLIVSDDAEHTLREAGPHVVVHATRSFVPAVQDQLLGCIAAGAHVVSSTEELSYPFERHPEHAATLDAAAKEKGVVVLGTGVNPGYAMDALVLMATGVCTEVDAVAVQRVVDAGKRRGPLQRKVGAGLSLAAFEEKKATGTFGHIGLRESLWLVAAGLGWPLDRIQETLDPVVAEQPVTTPHAEVRQGEVAGIHHAIAGYRNGTAVVSLDLKMYVGAEEPRDAVQVTGMPPIDLVIRGGIFGDTATVAALVNAVPLVREAAPGLRTVKDLPVPRAFVRRTG